MKMNKIDPPKSIFYWVSHTKPMHPVDFTWTLCFFFFFFSISICPLALLQLKILHSTITARIYINGKCQFAWLATYISLLIVTAQLLLTSFLSFLYVSSSWRLCVDLFISISMQTLQISLKMVWLKHCHTFNKEPRRNTF